MPAIPTQGSDPNKGSGDWLTDECDAVFVVETYKESGQPLSEDWHCLIDAYILRADNESQVGKKIKDERFYFMKGKNRIFEFSCALGLYSKPQWDADVAAGTSPNIPLESSEGMMFATPVRHKKWDESRDPGYWQGRIKDAPVKFANDPDKMQKEIEHCERVLREKKGKLQVGGSSGFTFWAIGDTEAEGIPLLPQDIAIFPGGMLPTKMGPKRRRGSGTPPRSPNGNGNGNGHSAPQAQQSPPAAVGADLW